MERCAARSSGPVSGGPTWLVDDGVPPNMVQRVMGHEKSATTLDLYTRRTDDPTRILRALDDDDPEEPDDGAGGGARAGVMPI